MKIGDKVKVLSGRKTGVVGTIKTLRDGLWGVEVPKTDRFYFFTSQELAVVPPAQDVDMMVRLAARRVVECWQKGLNIEPALQELEGALAN